MNRLNRLRGGLLRHDRIVRRAIASVGLLLLALDLVLQWKALHPYDPSLQRVQETGVLRVGLDPTYPPFSVLAGQSIIGLDVDLAEAVAARLGVRVQLVPLGIDGLYDALKSGQADVLISALTVDPWRMSDVIYTRSYIDAGQVIVKRAGASYLRLRDLAGQAVSVEYGSAADEIARAWAARLGALEIRHVYTPDAALDLLRAGQVEAALSDYVTARLYMAAHPEANLALSTGRLRAEPYAAALPIRSLKLAMAINAALEAMAEDGSLEAILNRWLSAAD